MGTAVALTLLAGAGLSLLTAQAEFRHRVKAALGRVAGLSVERISTDPLTGAVALGGLRFTTAGMRVEIGTAALRSAASPWSAFVPAAFAAGSFAQADDVTIKAGPMTFRLPHIEAAATPLSDTDLALLVEPGSRVGLAERLAKLTAASIVIPRLMIDIDAPDAVERGVLSNIAMVDVERGKIGALSIAGGSLSMSGRDIAAPVQGTIGTLIAHEFDLGLGLRLLTKARRDPAEPTKTLLESAKFDGLTLTAGEAFGLGIGRTSLGRVAARPPLQPLGEMLSALNFGAGVEPRNLKDLYDCFTMNSADVGDVLFRLGDPRVRIGFSHIGLAGLGDGSLQEIALQGLDVDAPTDQRGSVVKLKLGGFALRGLKFKQAVDAMANSIGSSQTLDPRDVAPTIDQILLTGLAADMPAFGEGNAVGGTRDKFQVSRIEFIGSDYLRDMPGAVSAAIDHVTFDVEPGDGRIGLLYALGYPRVDASAKIAARFVPAAQEYRLEDVSLASAGMGSISFKASFGNVSNDLFSGDLPVAQAALFAIVAKEADLRIENAGLFEKALMLAARTSHRTPDQKRGELIRLVVSQVPDALRDSALANAVVDAVVKFISQPTSLHINAKSDAGIGAADFISAKDPAALLGKVTLTVSANE
jgi:hypothetical protein